MSFARWFQASRARILALLGVTAYVLGLAGRAAYVLVLHHPRHFVVSDASNLTAIARRLISAPEAQHIGDTIWPPGAPALLALGIRFDVTLGAAAWSQLLLSALVPLLIAHATALMAGSSAAWLALIAASLHFGFVHYAGFVLSEQLFQLAVSLALWSSVLALRASEAVLAAPAAARDRSRLALLGAAPGAAWALATSLRPNALPVAALVAAALAYRWWRQRERRAPWLLAGGLFALLIGLAPLAARCTRLSGAFCPVSNNVAMNMVLGQAGEVMGLYFKNPAHPELDTAWVPPALLQHGYTRTRDVPFSIYDTGAAFGWFVQRFFNAPGAFLLRALGNALDLFRFEYWPDDPGGLNRRFAIVAKQVFFLGVLAPGLVAAVLALRRVLCSRAASASLVLLAVLPPALCLVAALSLGEPRYRIPFDGVFIVLAAALYARARPGAARYLVPERLRVVRPLLALSGVFVLAALLVIALVSHPSAGLAAKLGPAPPALAARSETRALADFGALKTRGSDWDAPGSYIYRCSPGCPELVVPFTEAMRARRVELALDHNDAYQITYYASGAPLARVTLDPAPRGAGLRLERIITPDSALSFDAIGVLPLYGDGRYSLGHLRPLP